MQKRGRERGLRLGDFLVLITSAVVGLTADLLTKHFAFASTRLQQGRPYDLLPGLSLYLSKNTGGLFGCLEGKTTWFIILSGVALGAIVMLFLSLKKPGVVITISLGIIAAGALGNLWDRVKYGAVRDFIDLHVRDSHWPTFNIADALICFGAAALILHAWKNKPEEDQDARKRKD